LAVAFVTAVGIASVFAGRVLHEDPGPRRGAVPLRPRAQPQLPTASAPPPPNQPVAAAAVAGSAVVPGVRVAPPVAAPPRPAVRTERATPRKTPATDVSARSLSPSSAVQSGSDARSPTATKPRKRHRARRPTAASSFTQQPKQPKPATAGPTSPQPGLENNPYK
jgi:hypothetical protein